MRSSSVPCACFPGGVLGGYYAPQELAFVVREGRGARLTDVSGREYIDYILGSGPLVLGHAHPAVVAAVEAQLRKGTTYFQLSEPALALAEEICRAVPCAEQMRFTSTGSGGDVLRAALCRAFRKRDKILKFEGGFHGTHDYSLMSVGPHAPKAFPAPTPDSAGIPHAIQDEVLIAPFNDLARDGGHHRRAPRRPGRRDHGAVPAADRPAAGLPRGRARRHARDTACR